MNTTILKYKAARLITCSAFTLWRLVTCTVNGEWRRIWREVHLRLYKQAWSAWWTILFHANKPVKCQFEVVTHHPIAYESPDHTHPKGTLRDNSTNRAFVLLLDERVREYRNPNMIAYQALFELVCEHPENHTLKMLDIGCSGGQLVADFLKIGWHACGLEGSDYSRKNKRANWRQLDGSNLHTADITYPFTVKQGGLAAQFDLITAWEVLEHLPTNRLAIVFSNVVSQLRPGGLFIASTTETDDIVDGVQLHQTRWTNASWREYIRTEFPELEPVDLKLKAHQYVRQNFNHPSFLTYRKKS